MGSFTWNTSCAEILMPTISIDVIEPAFNPAFKLDSFIINNVTF